MSQAQHLFGQHNAACLELHTELFLQQYVGWPQALQSVLASSEHPQSQPLNSGCAETICHTGFPWLTVV